MVNKEQQKANCLELADHLDHNVTDAEYDQNSFYNKTTHTSCAAGHAAFVGIGGLVMSNGGLVTNDDIPVLLKYINHSNDYLISIHEVFGIKNYHIFGSFYAGYAGVNPRKEVIKALRNAEF